MKKFIFTTIGLFIIYINPAKATSIINPNSSKYKSGDYQLNDILNIGIKVTKIILSLIGSISLLMFIYGGILMIVYGGGGVGDDGKSKINKGKDVITASLIGMIIVFTSFLLVKFILKTLGIDWNGNLYGIK